MFNATGSNDLNIPIALPIAAGAACALSTFFYGMFVPTSGLFGPVIVRGPQNRPQVALTFDDGPTREGTGPILDILAQTGTRATFFFIGRNVDRCPELVRRAVAEGHQVENHSFDHSRWGVVRSGAYWNDQWRQTESAIAAAGGPARTSFFRPPMGFKTWRMALAAKHANIRMVAWSLRGMDGVATTREAILERILPRARAGDIIALHDGEEPGRSRNPEPTIAALPRLIRGLREKGLEPVRLDDLINPPTSGAATESGIGSTAPGA